ncbi:MAG: response regulator transcription factor [Fluviicola sp.]
MDKILLIEDEKSISETLKLNLELEGYEVEVIDNGRLALEKANQLSQFDLVVLDVMLPEVSGFDICRTFRQHSLIPILFLSAKGSTTDRIAGLKFGANDYLPKPFDLEEFLLRCKVLLNTKNKVEKISDAEIGDWIIHFDSYQVENKFTAQQVELSKREIELLQLFVENEGKALSRDEILSNLWKNDQFPTGRTIDNYILNFRKIFEDDSKEFRFFHSIRGIGYKFTR